MDIFWPLDTCSKFHVVGALYHLFSRRWPFRNSHLSLSNKISLHAEFKVDLADEKREMVLNVDGLCSLYGSFPVCSCKIMQEWLMVLTTKSHIRLERCECATIAWMKKYSHHVLRGVDSHPLLELVTTHQKNCIDILNFDGLICHYISNKCSTLQAVVWYRSG